MHIFTLQMNSCQISLIWFWHPLRPCESRSVLFVSIIKPHYAAFSLLSHPDNRNTVAQFVGIHPSFAKHEDVVKFCSMLESNIQSIDGIGEIGLDRTYTLDNYSPYPKQLEVFELMLRLAERYHRPVSVHSRKSLDDIMQLMSTFRIPDVMLPLVFRQ